MNKAEIKITTSIGYDERVRWGWRRRGAWWTSFCPQLVLPSGGASCFPPFFLAVFPRSKFPTSRNLSAPPTQLSSSTKTPIFQPPSLFQNCSSFSSALYSNSIHLCCFILAPPTSITNSTCTQIWNSTQILKSFSIFQPYCSDLVSGNPLPSCKNYPEMLHSLISWCCSTCSYYL